MRKRTIALGVSGAALITGGIWFSSLDKETRGFLATFPTNADVLTWSQTQRDAAFRALDRLPFLAKANEIAASPTPLALPPGKPLAIPGLDEYLAGQHAAGIVILQDGKVRLEHYGLDFDAAGRWTSFSVAKSFTSTLVGAAVQDGSIKSLEDKVSQYVRDLRGSAYDDVTIRQLLTMSSGVKWNEDYEDPNSDVSRFNGAPPDPGVDATVSYMRKLPRAHRPGEVWSYNTGETNLVGVLVSSATGKPLAQYLQEKIWQPAGMQAGATWLKGKTGHEIAGCCIQAATRDFARFGLFVLAGGSIGGKQIVPSDWFAQATTRQKEIGIPGRGYGFQWWTYDDGSVAARGIFGQGIFIDRARRLVIASNADWTRASKGPEPEAREAFYRRVQALIDAGERARSGDCRPGNAAFRPAFASPPRNLREPPRKHQYGLRQAHRVPVEIALNVDTLLHIICSVMPDVRDRSEAQMTVTTLTSREFNQDASGAKKAARRGPVFITDRGRPAHVLLTIEDYRRLTGGNMSLAEALAQPGDADFDFEPPRVGGEIFKPADLG